MGQPQHEPSHQQPALSTSQQSPKQASIQLDTAPRRIQNSDFRFRMTIHFNSPFN
jgi:hypothetical protein